MQMKLMSSFLERSLSRYKLRFLTESEKEMVAWQIERGAGGCLSFEELNSKSFGGIINEVLANSTNTSDFQESCFADEIDVFFHREILI